MSKVEDPEYNKYLDSLVEVPTVFDPHDIYSPFFCLTIRAMRMLNGTIVFRASRGAGQPLTEAMLQGVEIPAVESLTTHEKKLIMPDCLFKRINYIRSGPKYGYHMPEDDWEQFLAALDASPHRFRVVEFFADGSDPAMALQQFPQDAPTKADVKAGEPLLVMSKALTSRTRKISKKQKAHSDSVDALPDALKPLDIEIAEISIGRTASAVIDRGYPENTHGSDDRLFAIKPPSGAKLFVAVNGRMPELREKYPAATERETLIAAWDDMSEDERTKYPELWVKIYKGVYIVPDSVIYDVTDMLAEIAPHIQITFVSRGGERELFREPYPEDLERAAQMAKDELRKRLEAKKHGAAKDLDETDLESRETRAETI